MTVLVRWIVATLAHTWNDKIYKWIDWLRVSVQIPPNADQHWMKSNKFGMISDHTCALPLDCEFRWTKDKECSESHSNRIGKRQWMSRCAIIGSSNCAEGEMGIHFHNSSRIIPKCYSVTVLHMCKPPLYLSGFWFVRCICLSWNSNWNCKRGTHTFGSITWCDVNESLNFFAAFGYLLLRLFNLLNNSKSERALYSCPASTPST